MEMNLITNHLNDYTVYKTKDVLMVLGLLVISGGVVVFFYFFPIIPTTLILFIFLWAIVYYYMVKNSVPYDKFDWMYFSANWINCVCIFSLMPIIFTQSKMIDLLNQYMPIDFIKSLYFLGISILFVFGLPALTLSRLFKIKETYKEYQDQERRKERLRY